MNDSGSTSEENDPGAKKSIDGLQKATDVLAPVSRKRNLDDMLDDEIVASDHGPLVDALSEAIAGISPIVLLFFTHI